MKIFVISFLFFITCSIGISQDLSKFGIDKSKEVPKGLNKGDLAPDFKSSDQHEKAFHLYDELTEQPVVVVFYRGHWCPYCNRYLGNLQDSLEYITDMGTKVVAITPQGAENIDKTIDKTGASFVILSDVNEEIMKKYDVLFSTTKNGRLPVPATYVIDRNKTVRYSHFDYNYKNRSTVKEILSVLKDI